MDSAKKFSNVHYTPPGDSSSTFEVFLKEKNCLPVIPVSSTAMKKNFKPDNGKQKTKLAFLANFKYYFF